MRRKKKWKERKKKRGRWDTSPSDKFHRRAEMKLAHFPVSFGVQFYIFSTSAVSDRHFHSPSVGTKLVPILHPIFGRSRTTDVAEISKTGPPQELRNGKSPRHKIGPMGGNPITPLPERKALSKGPKL